MDQILYGIKVVNGSDPRRELNEKMALEEIGDNFPELVEVVRLDGFLVVTATIDNDTITISSPEIAGRYTDIVNAARESEREARFEWR